MARPTNFMPQVWKSDSGANMAVPPPRHPHCQPNTKSSPSYVINFTDERNAKTFRKGTFYVVTFAYKCHVAIMFCKYGLSFEDAYPDRETIVMLGMGLDSDEKTKVLLISHHQKITENDRSSLHLKTCRW